MTRRAPQIARSHRGVHFACLACRIAFKKPSVDLTGHAETARFPCPECRRPMQYMGRSFKAPRRSATRQWKKVALLILHGYRFESYSNAPLPKTLRELEEMLRHERPSPNMLPRRAKELQDELGSAQVGIKSKTSIRTK